MTRKDSSFLILKNISREGPGLLERVLRQRRLAYRVIDLDAGGAIPEPAGYDALVVMGGPDSANDATCKMDAELAIIRECLNHGIPFLGICLGMQALVQAGGGKVVKSPVREIGFRDRNDGWNEVVLTREGMADPMFSGLGSRFRIFHLHGETVELADGMALLGAGRYCRNQVVRVGSNAWGIQGHFELTPSMLKLWLREDTELRQCDHGAIRADYDALREEYTATGLRLFRNFADIVTGKAR
jgi:GMP synthase-like glutamine amidotransferase